MDENELNKTNPFFDGYAFSVTASLKPGVIGTIEGVEKITAMPEVLHMRAMHKVGDNILPEMQGTLASVFAYTLCAVDTKEDLRRMIAQIRDNLTILDVDGNNMLNDFLDESLLKI